MSHLADCCRGARNGAPGIPGKRWVGDHSLNDWTRALACGAGPCRERERSGRIQVSLRTLTHLPGGHGGGGVQRWCKEGAKRVQRGCKKGAKLAYCLDFFMRETLPTGRQTRLGAEGQAAGGEEGCGAEQAQEVLSRR